MAEHLDAKQSWLLDCQRVIGLQTESLLNGFQNETFQCRWCIWHARLCNHFLVRSHCDVMDCRLELAATCKENRKIFGNWRPGEADAVSHSTVVNQHLSRMTGLQREQWRIQWGTVCSQKNKSLTLWSTASDHQILMGTIRKRRSSERCSFKQQLPSRN